MTQEIFLFDTQLFIFINHLPHNSILDIFFGIVTLVGYFGAIWIFIAIFLYIKNKIKYKKMLISVILASFSSFVLSELILKNLIQRQRPQYEINTTILPFDFYHSFSFPSGHACIAFAAALVLSKYNKQKKWLFYLLAFLISFSRIYLGKHYPSDVLAGAILGLIIGKLSFKITSQIMPKPLSTPGVEKRGKS